MKTNIKVLVAVVVLIIVGILAHAYMGQKPSASRDTIPEVVQQDPTPVSITKADIKEANFTGTRVVVKGSSAAAVAAQKYVDKTILEFKKRADTEVPDMRKEFGSAAAPASYSIDFDAKYIKGDKTESVIVSEYDYTGGANGMDIYKVFNASLADNKLLSLSSVIKADQKDAFVAYVKKALNDWRPDGSGEMVVFPEDVNALTFDSFTNWSLDNKNLTLYFDKYEIGPGVLGEVAFPLSLSEISSFLTTDTDSAKISPEFSAQLVLYTCADGKTIKASFGKAPIDNFAHLDLSDKRGIDFTKISSDDDSGTKYESANGKLDFWVHEDSAYLTENETTTYAACRAVVSS